MVMEGVGLPAVVPFSSGDEESLVERVTPAEHNHVPDETPVVARVSLVIRSYVHHIQTSRKRLQQKVKTSRSVL